jgi:hypothetical protein
MFSCGILAHLEEPVVLVLSYPHKAVGYMFLVQAIQPMSYRIPLFPVIKITGNKRRCTELYNWAGLDR